MLVIIYVRVLVQGLPLLQERQPLNLTNHRLYGIVLQYLILGLLWALQFAEVCYQIRACSRVLYGKHGLKFRKAAENLSEAFKGDLFTLYKAIFKGFARLYV